MQNHEIKLLTPSDSAVILKLSELLNPEAQVDHFPELLNEMWALPGFRCFGLIRNDQLVGIANGWITVRFYSGKQLEIDNVIVSPNVRSKGLGKIFVEKVEEWAIENGCKTIELNTYVQNSRSHKFYFNMGFKILGFHFQKYIGGK